MTHKTRYTDTPYTVFQEVEDKKISADVFPTAVDPNESCRIITHHFFAYAYPNLHATLYIAGPLQDGTFLLRGAVWPMSYIQRACREHLDQGRKGE